MRVERLARAPVTVRVRQGALALAILAMLVAPVMPVLSEGSGDYPPPASGDWVITQDTWVENETVYLNEDLDVIGAKLTLRNTTIVINYPYAIIHVEAGAAIETRDCIFKGAGNFEIDGSALFDKSSFWPGKGENPDQWLVLNTSNASMTDCVLEGGIDCYSVPAPVFKNTTVRNSSHGALFRGATTYGGLTFVDCRDGAYGGPGTIISNCTFERCGIGALICDRTEIVSSGFINCSWGIWDWDVNSLPPDNVIRNCTFAGCDIGYHTGLNSTIADSKFVGCVAGIVVERNATLSGCEFLRCDRGIIGSYADDVRILDSTFSENSQAVNISVSNDSTIIRCVFEAPAWATSDSPPILEMYGFFEIIDSVLSGGEGPQMSIRSGGVTATNTSFAPDRVMITWGTWLGVAWYLDASVLYPNGTPADGATLRVVDHSGQSLASPMTGPDGRIQRLWVREYLREWNRTIYFTPISLNASKDGLAKNLSVNLNQNMDLTLTLGDVSAPSVLFTSPQNNTLQNKTTCRFTGTASDDQTVTSVRLRAGSGAWVAANGTSEWTATLDLNQGDNSIVAEASDSAGNTGSARLTMKVDSWAPVVEIIYPSQDFLVNTTSIELTGRTEPGCTVLVDGEAAPFYLGHFSATVALQEGPNTILVSARDAAGNVGTAAVNVTRDTIPPALTLTTPRNGEVTGRTIVNISGTAEPGAVVYINEVVLARSGTFFSVQVMLSEGVNNISVRAVDAAGNEATVSARVILDRTPPAVTVELQNGTLVRSAMLRLAGRTEPGASVSVNGVPVDVSPDGNFSADIPLMAGPNLVHVEAADPSGNAASLDRTVIYEEPARPPTPTVPEPESGVNAGLALGMVVVAIIILAMAVLFFRGRPPSPASIDSESSARPARREP